MFRILLRHADVSYPAPRRRGGRFKALRNVSIRISGRDRVGILGKNGSGKSTLLRMIAGIYRPETGLVAVEGRISSLFNVGLGVQLEATGYQNIRLASLMAGVKPRDVPSMVADVAAFTELGEFLDNPVRTYSSGMAMRLKFACATAHKPNILLLDEWLGAGDTEFQQKARMRMQTLVDEAGIVLLATHNIPLMKQVCSRAIWLDKGRVLMDGPIDEVLEARRHAADLLKASVSVFARKRRVENVG